MCTIARDHVGQERALHLTLLCQLAEEGKHGCVDDGGGGDGSGRSGKSDERKRQAWRRSST